MHTVRMPRIASDGTIHACVLEPRATPQLTKSDRRYQLSQRDSRTSHTNTGEMLAECWNVASERF